MTATTKLGLELLASAAGNQTQANTTFAQLNQLVMAAAIDKDLSTPPGSPANEALYIVAASPTGAWSGNAGKLAYWLNNVGVWTFITPIAGFIVYVVDEATYYKFNGTAWVINTVLASPAPVITESSTSRTLGLSSAGAYIRFTNSSASGCTVDTQASASWTSDTEIHIRRAGAGNLTITPGSGVTLNVPSGGTLVLSEGMSVTLKRVAADNWDVIGQTVPA